jgi:8-oxo-dGTP diphosphatase
MAFTYEYPHPAVTVDCVIFGLDLNDPAGMLRILLIRRADPPFAGGWAIPGGFVNIDEDIEDAARRELEEETGIKVAHLEQLYTFGKPMRDPRERVISVAHLALVQRANYKVQSGSDASDAQWFPVDRVMRNEPLAFDHREILQVALARLQAKVRYAPIGFNLMPEKFSLADLKKFYEALLCRPLDKGNFRKRILAMGILKEVGTRDREVPAMSRSYRAMLYRFDKRAYDRAVKDGFNFEI